MQLTATILALTLATASSTDIHPRYHEANRAAAANVVIMRIERLNEHGLSDMGDCTLTGRVEAVERGTRLTHGQALTVSVPCYVNAASLPSSGMQWQAVHQLRAAGRGRVWLNAEGGQINGRYFRILD